MIGHRLGDGFTILAAAPESNDDWVILAYADDGRFQPYVVSSVDVAQLPAPTSWGQGHYHQKVDEAVDEYLDRISTASRIVRTAVLNAQQALRKPTYRAHFAPQAWSRDNAIDVDPEGEQEWDCTAWAAKLEPAYMADLFANNQWQVIDNEDRFKDDPAAPQWVQDWTGPFTIHIERTGAQDKYDPHGGAKHRVYEEN